MSELVTDGNPGRGVLAFAVLGAIALGAATALLEPDLVAITLFALTLVLTGPLLLRAVQRRFDVFEPLVIFGVTWALFFIVKPLAMLDEPLAYVRETNSVNIEDTFLPVLGLALLGAVGFMTGYFASFGARLAARLPRPPERVDPDRVAILAGGVVAASLVLTALFVLSTGIGLGSMFGGRSLELTQAIRGSSSYLWLASMATAPAAIVLIVAGVESRQPILTLTGAITALMFLARVLTQGNRIFLLPFVVALLAYWYLRKQRQPSPVAIITLCATALVAWSLLLATRSADPRYETGFSTQLSEIAADPTQVISPFTEGADNEMMPALAAALTVIPQHVPHTYGGATFGDLMVRGIPRSVWPTKPQSPRESINEYFWPREYQAGVVNVEFSVLLYLFLDAGVIGVLVGLSLLGVVARALYEYYLRYPHNFTVHVLLGLGLAFMVPALRDSPVDNLVRAAFLVLPAMLILFVAGATRSSPALSAD